MSAVNALSNHIILSIVLEDLSAAKDIFALANTHNLIYQTVQDSIRNVRIKALSFRGSRIRGNKAIIGKVPIFELAKWRDLRILNLSHTNITIISVRTLFKTIRGLRILQLNSCQRVHVGNFITMFEGFIKARRRDTATMSLMVLDVWDIDGLRLDYKYQNSKEWFFESYCTDNKNLMSLQRLAMTLEIQLNIQFCEGEAHDSVSDIRYHPAARQKWGYTACELVKLDHGVRHLCDTCILRLHNKHNNKRHQCRQEHEIDTTELEDAELEIERFKLSVVADDSGSE